MKYDMRSEQTGYLYGSEWVLFLLTSVLTQSCGNLRCPSFDKCEICYWKMIDSTKLEESTNPVWRTAGKLCPLLTTIFSDWFSGSIMMFFTFEKFHVVFQLNFLVWKESGVLMTFLSSCHCTWHFDFMPDLLTDHSLTTMKIRTFEVHAWFPFSPFPTLLPTAEIIFTSANTLHCLSSLFQKLSSINNRVQMNLLTNISEKRYKRDICIHMEVLSAFSELDICLRWESTFTFQTSLKPDVLRCYQKPCSTSKQWEERVWSYQWKLIIHHKWNKHTRAFSMSVQWIDLQFISEKRWVFVVLYSCALDEKILKWLCWLTSEHNVSVL